MMLPWLSAHYQQFVARMRQRTLHHALMLSGPAGLGKYVLAEQLAKTLLCKQPTVQGSCEQCQSCQLFAAGNHPDFHQLVSDKQLGVDAIRSGISKLSGTAQLGNNKVLIIPNADTMTEAASNALLKTLEEPTTNTYLLLLTSKKTALLPTILSRCEKHDLRLPNEQQIIQWLAEQGFENVSAATLKAYGYSPFIVRNSLAEETAGFAYQDYQQGLSGLMAGAESPRSLGVKWQEHAAQVVKWLQIEAHEKYTQTLSSKDYKACVVCQQVAKQLLHPGINKTVVLAGVLDVFLVNPI